MSIQGEAQYSKAIALALMNTTALNSAMVAVAQAKDEFTGAPIKLMMAMLTELPEATIDGLPRIGSKQSETDNPDIFKWKNPADDSKEKDVSFYVVWSDNTPEGAKVVTELGWLSCLSDKDKKRDHISAEYQQQYSNPQVIKQRKKYLEARRGTIRASYKKAAALMHQFDAINELDGVTATTSPGAIEGTYENTILITSKIAGREKLDWAFFSVGSFLKLNAAKASEQGGTLAALEATVARDTKKKAPVATGIPALNGVKTPETMDVVLTAVHSYVDSAFSDKKGDAFAALLKFLVGPGGASAVETIGDLNKQLSELMKMDHIQFIYQKAKDAQHKAAA